MAPTSSSGLGKGDIVCTCWTSGGFSCQTPYGHLSTDSTTDGQKGDKITSEKKSLGIPYSHNRYYRNHLISGG